MASSTTASASLTLTETAVAAALVALRGTAGDDTLTGTSADELIEGLAGSDELKSGGGDDTLLGGPGDDVLRSGRGNETLDGGDGYDYLYFDDDSGPLAINLITGRATGAGNDTIANVEIVFGTRFSDSFTGHDNGVVFLGGGGHDHIVGGAGRDTLEGNEGDDVIDGGLGIDTTAFYSAAFAINVDLTAGRATGGLGNDTLLGIENAVGSVFGDTMKGSGGDNRLEGSDGDDTFIATFGNDTLEGGNGIDTAAYTFNRNQGTLSRSAASGEYSLGKAGNTGTDALPHVERLRFADTHVALDLDGHAGQTAKLLGAVFGVGAVSNPAFVGIGLKLLDGGMSYTDLAAMAVAAAGVSRHADVVGLLWSNLFGQAPTSAQAAPFVAMLDAGTSIGTLTAMAADTSYNTTQIDLVGLSQRGIDFTPAP